MPSEVMQLFKLIGLGLAFLLPMANPLTSMVMYLSLGETLSAQEKKQQLRQATLYVILALLITYYAGLW
ncbi:MAG: MarC family protein, partial [Alcaligenes aquatilis]